MWDAEFTRRVRAASFNDNGADSEPPEPRTLHRSSASDASDSVGVVTRSMARRREAEQLEQQQQQQEPTPPPLPNHTGSPTSRYVRRSPQFNYDRFIPTRANEAADYIGFVRDSSPTLNSSSGMLLEHRMAAEAANRTYDAMLRSELLNDRSPIVSAPKPKSPVTRRSLRAQLPPTSPQLPSLAMPWSSSQAGGNSSRPNTPPASPGHSPVFSYKSPRRTLAKSGRSQFDCASPVHEAYQMSPVKPETRRMLKPQPAVRRLPREPIKVLDAPGISDDYYLNLLDWSIKDRVVVALGTAVFLWDAKTSQVRELFDSDGPITSVKWAERGRHLAVGTSAGTVQIWDVEKSRKIRDFAGHTRRVGSLEWNSTILSSGSRDKHIINRDTRMRQGAVVSTYYAHEQEVCGLRWSPDKIQLASGGNDNHLFIWDSRYTPLNALMHSTEPEIAPGARSFRRPLFRLTGHTAAVKALAWSPVRRGLLASGGGSGDKTIRFWDTTTGRQVSCTDSGSQVCNLSWSRDGSELVSSHGFSMNHIVVWNYPAMKPVGVLRGHTSRVLFMAHSPDGQTIVTAAPDETLRFWSVFSKPAPPNPGLALLGTSTSGLLLDLAPVR
ncbi:substrate-specific activator of APC-dependent proteolysis [Linderina macrospora]|uniref:Substrate-specific activator of APC-dependent proteolysis n=1 Tax=Linderina macrospora TaxID=4868 RepID=A0ACC1JCK0_9FUNG|nr:substrate-specific activator of APC-dependent proteolysis [Linderina macrospora]